MPAFPLQKLDFISAHGTATIYNDEMEAKAISLAGLESVPVNSLKGIMAIHSVRPGSWNPLFPYIRCEQNIMLPTQGFNKPGVSRPIAYSSSFGAARSKLFFENSLGFRRLQCCTRF